MQCRKASLHLTSIRMPPSRGGKPALGVQNNRKKLDKYSVNRRLFSAIRACNFSVNGRKGVLRISVPVYNKQIIGSNESRQTRTVITDTNCKMWLKGQTFCYECCNASKWQNNEEKSVTFFSSRRQKLGLPRGCKSNVPISPQNSKSSPRNS